MSPADLSRCDHMGACMMHAACQDRFKCASRVRPGAHETQDPPFTHADYALRLCWGAMCVVAALGAFLLGCGLLWWFDASLPAEVRTLITRLIDLATRLGPQGMALCC